MDWVVLADDIGDFLTQHNISKAVLVGHSMGGRASFTFALKKVILNALDNIILFGIYVYISKQCKMFTNKAFTLLKICIFIPNIIFNVLQLS